MIDDFTSKHVLKFLEPLQAHIKELETKLDSCEKDRRLFAETIANGCACEHDGRGDLVTECQEHQRIREERDSLSSRLDSVRRLCEEQADGGSWDSDYLTGHSDMAESVLEILGGGSAVERQEQTPGPCGYPGCQLRRGHSGPCEWPPIE
jgi:hypothetical protein